MVIDHTHLNESTLTALIEQFLHRDDHSIAYAALTPTDKNQAQKNNIQATIALIKKMLNLGEMHLTFDAQTESVNILTSEQLKQLEAGYEVEN